MLFTIGFEYKVSASEMFAGAYYYAKKSIAEIMVKVKSEKEEGFVVMVVGKM